MQFLTITFLFIIPATVLAVPASEYSDWHRISRRSVPAET
ncbi:Protein of unknown function [Pyronema omphalodes CBS 100304]|uniref:Uncharacterized protein n=1 Tax=Pyronema omphalodes (strain CBS 100304) TaxID=1076935 RepID=U4LGS1_PYROM|nr:Protein of unknown function [Pyronema omphalodes CBS 100304]